LLYTGITRPQKRLTLVATLASIEMAIKTPIRRATGLADRL
jgi:ATP-dependent exoDNAse (exonuclease V) alpha subunit